MRAFHICLLALGLILPSLAYADHDTYVTIYPNLNDSLTVPNYAEAVSIVRKTAGNNSIVSAKKFEDTHVVNFKDMLATTPGVEAQNRVGEEMRLSIRGSGLSRGYHLRGLYILQDGMPINLADGGGDLYEIDPLMVQYIEVYRGGNALRYGAATLGGAINVITPTGETNPGTELRMEGGSNGTFRFHAANGEKFKDGDSYAAITRSVAQGYRDHTAENKMRFTGNTGYRINDNVETRFSLTWNDLDQQLPSTLSLYDATHNPRASDSLYTANSYQRNIRSLRLSNKTAFDIDDGQKIVTGFFMNDKHLYHPIFQVIDQHSLDVGTFARFESDATTAGINITHNHVDARQYVNNGGLRGALTAEGTQHATNMELYGEQRWKLASPLTLITGMQGSISSRGLDSNSTPANSADKTYLAINPKLGLLYEPAANTQIFANVSHSAEPPTFGELIQSPVPGFVNLENQKAWTTELGTRFQHNSIHVDATVYRSWVKDEMLMYSTTPTIPASTFNANNTIHQGVELGIGALLAPRIHGNLTYTYNDFFFDSDKQFNDNKLAGAPPQNIRASLRYEHPSGWFIEPIVEWVPEGGYVDYANKLRSSDFMILNANAGMDITPNIKIFLDARNLFDEKYAATYSTVIDARTANTNVFYPGDGRALYAGLSVKF